MGMLHQSDRFILSDFCDDDGKELENERCCVTADAVNLSMEAFFRCDQCRLMTVQRSLSEAYCWASDNKMFFPDCLDQWLSHDGLRSL